MWQRGEKMTVGEFIERLQMLGVSSNAKLIVWDNKEHEYNIVNVDSVFNDEVAVDIKRTKEDLSGR